MITEIAKIEDIIKNVVDKRDAETKNMAKKAAVKNKFVFNFE